MKHMVFLARADSLSKGLPFSATWSVSLSLDVSMQRDAFRVWLYRDLNDAACP